MATRRGRETAANPYTRPPRDRNLVMETGRIFKATAGFKSVDFEPGGAEFDHDQGRTEHVELCHVKSGTSVTALVTAVVSQPRPPHARSAAWCAKILTFDLK
ncbi:hypothetical protein EVAR_29944_1 [Eumeta japonica]|uniref:Uncharacterized protein n=1 Tax=Eumeta variegata TaxID=151549 RepID=A0A4C1VGI9_EUMVA|nr:hypothetical protein EVAR_29944_1 [Eumeta japonica]